MNFAVSFFRRKILWKEGFLFFPFSMNRVQQVLLPLRVRFRHDVGMNMNVYLSCVWYHLQIERDAIILFMRAENDPLCSRLLRGTTVKQWVHTESDCMARTTMAGRTLSSMSQRVHFLTSRLEKSATFWTTQCLWKRQLLHVKERQWFCSSRLNPSTVSYVSRRQLTLWSFHAITSLSTSSVCRAACNMIQTAPCAEQR